MFGLNNIDISVNQHIFWDQKEHFQLDEDIDSNWVLYAIEDGEFSFEISSHRGIGKFGDIIICPPNTVFKRKVINTLTFHFINFSLNNNNKCGFPIGKISITDFKRLNNTYYYLKLLCYSNNDKELSQWKSSLIDDIIKLYYIEKHYNNSPKNFVNDNLINYSLKYLNKNAYKNNFKFKDLANSLGLSSVQFTRRFEKCMGQTPIEYITSLRLRRAQVLLLRTNDILDTIAIKCGYDNGFYLSRVFSKKLNITPSDYKKKYL